jgi:cytochrome b subunit of formate dehydrogenase
MKNDLQMVYEKGSELYIIPYILFSLVFVITGIILVIKNNMKDKTFTSYVNDMQDKTLIY